MKTRLEIFPTKVVPGWAWELYRQWEGTEGWASLAGKNGFATAKEALADFEKFREVVAEVVPRIVRK